MGYIYFGEKAGARILRYGVGFTQVGDGYAFDVQTWDLRPAGDVGDVVFRTIDMLVRHRLGYSLEVTPVLDGIDLPAQTFSGGAPPTGSLEETVQIQAPILRRGNKLAVRVRTLSLLGETEIVNVASSNVPIRVTP